jgi:hypothetical protein
MAKLFYVTPAQVGAYEECSPAFRAVYEEIQELCKKKPEATLSKTKVVLVNRILVDVTALLSETPGAKYLDLLKDDELPQYSDVVLVLAQFAAVLDAFRSRHFGHFYGEHQWVTREAEKTAKKES